MYGQYQDTYVCGIEEMIMKDKDGNIATYSTADLGDTPRWYIANADGTPYTKGYGPGGNYPKPNEEFYIKVIKFYKNKAYLTFKISKIETHSSYVNATGWYTFVKGSTHQCASCEREDDLGCGKEWTETYKKYRVRYLTGRMCYRCGRTRPSSVTPGDDWGHLCNSYTWATRTVKCTGRVGGRMCCSIHTCGGPSDDYYEAGVDSKGNAYNAGYYTCATQTKVNVRSQYINVVEEPYREETEINLELEIKLDCVDLSLRKFVTGITDVDDVIYNADGSIKDAESKQQEVTNRIPQVDTGPIRREEGTTAIYNHTKEPLKVKVGDIVEYTIRVYNEGTANGYAEEVTDYLPTNLEFISGVVDGVDYGWKATTENGITVLKTNYLSDKIFVAFQTEGVFRPNNVGADGLDYKDLKLICRVKDEAVANEKITNIAEVTKYKDKEGNILDGDTDSEPNNVKLPTNDAEWQNYNGAGQTGNYVKGQEDEDDFEKLTIEYTDIEGTVWKDCEEGKQEERDNRCRTIPR